ncbi:TcaA NTF2-like domain-containing protein [Mammaliicoccus lentus]|uniref:TcaA NTF2-like domain-containing protein n=1 Tax=Mammaliicoccus lentus TaxID=42858 RepID=UPI003F7F3DC2
MKRFKESSFQVILDNDEQLKDLKIYVNGVQTKYDENRIYGPYPSNRSISVHAEGKYKGKTLKSNTVKVKENKDINHQKITMKFDTTKIDEMIKKDRRIENEAKAFMNDYTKDLNKAYKEVDYKHVEKYFESNSSLSNHIKSMVDSKNKSKYTMPIYTSYKKDGSKIYIELIKKDKSNNTIKSQYELAYNRKDKSFKIVSYGDV